VISLVSAFKRGAMLAFLIVIVFAFVRSPPKAKKAIGLAMVVGVLLVVAAAEFFSGKGRGGTYDQFWAEMGTAITQTEQSSGTAGDREILWSLARREFYDNPLVGVGADNFGPYAARHFAAGTVGGEYDANPARLYDRALHSTYFEALCEYGVVGSLILVWLLVDFWTKNRRLRSPAFGAKFDAGMGGVVNLKYLALSLEGSMVGFLVSGAFYNQLYAHWLYTLIGVNLLLYELSRPGAGGGAPRRLDRAARP